MIRSQQVLFEKLGSHSDATNVRARLQCHQLKSDMQAFKAANPKCSRMEDFVRWHSPKDFILVGEDDDIGGIKGDVSERMKEEGNLWKEIWNVYKLFFYNLNLFFLFLVGYTHTNNITTPIIRL